MRADSIWRNRDFRLLLAGDLVNDVGDWLLSLALPIFVFTESGSGRNAATIYLVELVVGLLVGSYGGSLADRWDLKRTIVATNVLQAVTLLPLLAVSSDRVWPAFMVAAIQAVLKQVNDPASFAIIPRVVSEEHLIQANAARATGSTIARLVGAPLGGIAVAAGGLNLVVLVDGLTFGFVALSTLLVRTPATSLVDDVNHRPGVAAGWREIRANPGLTGLLVVQMLARSAFAMFPVLFIKFVTVVLGGGGAEIGLMRGCAAIGGVAASLLIARFQHRANGALLMVWGYLSYAGIAAVFVNAPRFTTAIGLYFALFAITGLPNAAAQIGFDSTAQLLCPPAVLGRLSGLAAAAGAGGAIAGTVVIALLVDSVHVVPLFNAQAGVYLLCGIAAYLFVIRPLHAGPTTSE